MKHEISAEEREKIVEAARAEAQARMTACRPMFRSEAGQALEAFLSMLVFDSDVEPAKIQKYLNTAYRAVEAARAAAQAPANVSEADAQAARDVAYLRAKEAAGAIGLAPTPASASDGWARAAAAVNERLEALAPAPGDALATGVWMKASRP